MKNGYNAVRWMRVRPEDKRGGQGKHADGFTRLPAEPGGALTLASYLDAHLEWMSVRNYAEHFVESRRYELKAFFSWAEERALFAPTQITRSILESYQRWLYNHRKKNGKPLGITTQRSYLGALMQFFAWLTRQHVIEANPASELELPRPEKRLPVEALSISQVESILAQPAISDPLGIRDRAVMELLYSTGIRRTELARLELSDLNREKKLLRIRLGKGRKDRVVPVGARAMQWIEKYLNEVRHLLALESGTQPLFLSGYGEAFNPDVLGRKIGKYIETANIGRAGGAHLFRHTCATHMLEGGADIRYIQQLLGHEKLETTAIYTEVSIIQLQAVHARCHPAERHDKPDAAPVSTDGPETAANAAEKSSLFSRQADPPEPCAKAEATP
jgi:integrase/recombinase XerD